MRWLVGHPGPSFSVADVHDGWVEALRGLGEDVFTFNLDRRLQFYDSALMAEDISTDDGRQAIHKALPREQAVELAAEGILSAAYRVWPHVVLLVSAFFTPPYLLDMMRGRGHKVVLLHTESPYQDDEQLVRAAHADLNLLNDPVSISRYQELAPAQYMPHAYRPGVHYPAPESAQKPYDLSFVGTGFPSRVEFFNRMDLSGLRVKLAGPWQNPQEWADVDHPDCVDNTETAAIYRQSRAGINFYRREGEDAWNGSGWAMGPREVELAACGTFFLRDPRPEGDEVLHMLPTFASPEDAGEQLRWWLAHDSEREKAAQRAREAIADRTFTNNARKLLATLNH